MPDDPLQELQDLASDVGEVLSAYIAVHNRIFNEAASLKSVLKNLLGRGVPMSQLLADAEALVPQVEDIKNRVCSFTRAPALALPSAARAYAELLDGYAVALACTVESLVVRQRLLFEGSRGGRGNPMTWDSFKAADRTYERAITSYRALGARLNDSGAAVFPQ